MRFPLLTVATLVLTLAARCSAQTAYPMLMSLQPVATQTGQTTEHTIKSRYSMFGAYQVLVTGGGVTGEIVHPEVKAGETPELQEMKVRFTVAADALPGVRDFRIGTPSGASTIGQLVVAADPIAAESGDNNSREAANAVTLPATICGVIEKNEDVDYFRFHVEAGQALSFHVRSQRLQDRIHDLQQHVDPIISLRNSNGTTLASNDNYFFADPFLNYEFAQAGDYFLEIRDVRYQGNQYWEYAIEVHHRPFVTNLFPMAVGRGQQAKLDFVGFRVPDRASSFVNVSFDKPVGQQSWRLPMGEQASNPAPVVVSELPILLESPAENNSPDKAQPVALPVGVSGRIEAESDIDCFAFAAMKGERYSFEVVARRNQSALDSHLRILDSAGKQLAANDDLQLGKRGFADSQLEFWAPPADGIYIIELRDLHLRGAENFVYYLRATRSLPYFELYVDTDKTQLTPGTGGAIFVRAVRKNGFTGEIQLGIDGLPPGVTASCGRILADKGQDGCLVLQVDHDAPQQLANVTIRGTATHPLDGGDVLPLSATAAVYQEIYQPGGGRGHWPADMHTIFRGPAQRYPGGDAERL